MAHLDDNLILDFEDGYRALSVMKVQVRTAQDLFQVKKLLAAKKRKQQELSKKIIDERFDEFLAKTGLNRATMSKQQLSLARSIMKSLEECPYT